MAAISNGGLNACGSSRGIASARHTSGLVARDAEAPFCFDAPLGPSVIRWDIKNSQRKLHFQIHSDLVVCMRRSPCDRYIATCSTGGEMKIWTDGWTILTQTITPIQSLFHLGWSNDSHQILLVANGFNSSVLLYCLDLSEEGPSLELEWTSPAGSICDYPRESTIVKETASSHDPSHDQSHDQSHRHDDLYYIAEINPHRNCVAIEEREKACTVIRLLDGEDGRSLMTTPIRSIDGRREVHTLMMSSHHDGKYAIMLEGGYVVMVTAHDIQITNIFNVGYTSRTCLWDHNLLILPSDTGNLTWFNTSTGDKVSQYKVNCSDFIVHINFSQDNTGLWVCGFSKLSYCDVTRDSTGKVLSVVDVYHLHTHEISCCGVGVSNDSAHLAVGDLAGNVYLYGCHDDSPFPLAMWNLESSVRCIVWIDSGVLLVGCLDGVVHYWDTSTGIVKKFFAMDGSVINMKISHDGKYLAVGTSKGVLGVYSLSHGDVPCPVSVFLAHPPSNHLHHDPRFGQLSIQAEIWSVCWSPSNGRIATCSEDQTVRVWNTSSWVCVAKLTGHTLAVTSVDWTIAKGRSLLASCSDDRTLRLYVTTCEDKFELLNVISTAGRLHGWHTLTYLAFTPHNGQDDDKCMLALTTQHGYILVYDLSSGHVEVSSSPSISRKMHCGSVEGCVWGGDGRLATVGGDCAAYLWTTIMD